MINCYLKSSEEYDILNKSLYKYLTNSFGIIRAYVSSKNEIYKYGGIK